MIASGGWPGKDQGKGLGCWPAVIYFLVLVVLGQMIILNLFLAILMGNFEESSDEIRAKEQAMREAARKEKDKMKRMSHVANIIRDANRMKTISDKRDATAHRRVTKMLRDEIGSIPDRLDCR